MNIFILIVILIFLIFIYFKINFKGYTYKSKVMSIIHRIYLSKDNQIIILNIMDEYYLCSATKSEIRILDKIDRDKICGYLTKRE